MPVREWRRGLRHQQLAGLDERQGHLDRGTAEQQLRQGEQVRGLRHRPDPSGRLHGHEAHPAQGPHRLHRLRRGCGPLPHLAEARSARDLAQQACRLWPARALPQDPLGRQQCNRAVALRVHHWRADAGDLPHPRHPPDWRFRVARRGHPLGHHELHFQLAVAEPGQVLFRGPRRGRGARPHRAKPHGGPLGRGHCTEGAYYCEGGGVGTRTQGRPGRGLAAGGHGMQRRDDGGGPVHDRCQPREEEGGGCCCRQPAALRGHGRREGSHCQRGPPRLPQRSSLHAGPPGRHRRVFCDGEEP
mmetsp:Transcript_71675/g.213936  ORF Transcript_71675/g.213936 Transcript_71675/m.213936 type:complete len:301 (+) Transcript_71675:1812-2714(+)